MPVTFKLFYILNDSGIEYEIRNYCARNFGTDGYSNFAPVFFSRYRNAFAAVAVVKLFYIMILRENCFEITNFANAS